MNATPRVFPPTKPRLSAALLPSFMGRVLLGALCGTGLFLVPGCALALFGAGAGAGYVITRELEGEGGLESEVREDVDVVWLASIESLDILHDLKTDVIVQDSPREARAVVDGREITLQVDAYDLNRTILRVQAQGPLGVDEDAARRVMEDIVARLKR